MRAASVVLASALVVAGCGAQQDAGAPPRVAAATPAAGVEPAVDDDRAGLPRVTGDDVTPEFTTRTTLLAGNRAAIVLTLSDAVLFEFGSAELRPEAENVLATVAGLLNRQPATHAEVAGHTDSIGSAAFNHALSQARAATVVDWLVDNGVARDRLRAVGYGATRPVAGNATDDDRRRNRRVELTVS